MASCAILFAAAVCAAENASAYTTLSADVADLQADSADLLIFSSFI